MRNLKLTKKNLQALENILESATTYAYHLEIYSDESDPDCTHEKDAAKLEKNIAWIYKMIEEAK